MKVEEWRYTSTHILISVVTGSEWLISHRGHKPSMEGTDVTHCIVGWVDFRAFLDVLVKEKSSPLQGIERRFLGHPARNVIIVLTELSRFSYYTMRNKIITQCCLVAKTDDPCLGTRHAFEHSPVS